MYVRAAQVERIKRRIGIEESDKESDLLILDYLEDAEEAIKGWCNRTDIEDGMASAIRQTAIAFYNREGNEGESSRSEGGVSQTFEDGIPSTARATLARFRKATVSRIRR